MLDTTHLPCLTFPDVKVGVKEAQWDLRPLLYKGGAKALVYKVGAMIDAGTLGIPILERITLVLKIHETISDQLASGGAKSTAFSRITLVRYLFRWSDETGNCLSLVDVEATYHHWTDHLLHRVRVVKDLTECGAYNYGSAVGMVIDRVLERRTPILLTTRLKKPKRKKISRGIHADKQNLEETFSFGQALLDICDGLSINALWGPLPVQITLRTQQTLVEWSGLMPPEELRWFNPQTSQQHFNAKKAPQLRAAYSEDRTLRTRFSLVNLRIEAEMLIFMCQTGMNLSQAHQLRYEQFSFKSIINGFEARSYKHRRGGSVLFEIFDDYKQVFKRYLAWRNEVFPDDPDGLLFPLIRKGGRTEDNAPSFDRVRKTCKKLGLVFIGPQKLRNTRVNWLLRRSRDPDLTAEMDQHTKQTLLNVYEEPNLPVTMSEVTRFWQLHDPANDPPAPGVCIGSSPSPVEDIPAEATPPDCLTPSGCLWCQHQRDIDSLDHVWSLISFRFLKSQELARYIPPVLSKTPPRSHPADLAIKRITAKLHYFKQSSELRTQWVEECLVRIDEGNYHPNWVGLIDDEQPEL